MTDVSTLTDAERVTRLLPPAGPVRAVLDTDTYNEVDDQFALAYALLAPERIALEAVYAAPFLNQRSDGPGDGMQRSYDEILRVLDKMGRDDFAANVFHGSRSYLPAPAEPVASPAADDLCTRAAGCTAEQPLYVLAIGAPTNVAAAILADPALIERIVVVWLGGNPLEFPTASEFNLQQDLHASRVLFDSGVPLMHIPCRNVAEHLRTTIPELEACLRGRSALADYLVDIVRGYHAEHFAWSKVIWDISTVAWLLEPGWVPSHLDHAPILTAQLTYSRDPSRHLIRCASHCDRDAIFGDLFTRLATC